MKDLSENELAFIRDGCAQLLPTRDAAGRCVLAFNSNRDSFLKQKKVIVSFVYRNIIPSTICTLPHSVALLDL